MSKFYRGNITSEYQTIKKMGVVRSTLTKTEVMQQLNCNEVQLAAKILDGTVHRFFIDKEPFFQINA